MHGEGRQERSPPDEGRDRSGVVFVCLCVCVVGGGELKLLIDHGVVGLRGTGHFEDVIRVDRDQGWNDNR